MDFFFILLLLEQMGTQQYNLASIHHYRSYPTMTTSASVDPANVKTVHWKWDWFRQWKKREENVYTEHIFHGKYTFTTLVTFNFHCTDQILRHFSKYLLLCSTEDKKLYKFGMIWGWANDDRWWLSL